MSFNKIQERLKPTWPTSASDLDSNVRWASKERCLHTRVLCQRSEESNSHFLICPNLKLPRVFE